MASVHDVMRKVRGRLAKAAVHAPYADDPQVKRQAAQRLAKRLRRYCLVVNEDGKVQARRIAVVSRDIDGSTQRYTVLPAKLLPHERKMLAEAVAAHFAPRKRKEPSNG
jgi:hypothetical protein